MVDAQQLLQLQHSYSIPTEEDYIEIIKKKTAVLFTISAESAAISVGATSEQREALRQFAEYLGICFQIKDDILSETGDEKILGKPVGHDSESGKSTFVTVFGINESKNKLKSLKGEMMGFFDNFKMEERSEEEVLAEFNIFEGINDIEVANISCRPGNPTSYIVKRYFQINP